MTSQQIRILTNTAVQTWYLGAMSRIFRMVPGEPAEYTDPSYKRAGEVAYVNGN